MSTKNEGKKYMGSVKVGPKGQIVIPKEVREMFDISPGDALIILAAADRGIAIERYNAFEKVADAIFEGKSKSTFPKDTEEDYMAFAKSIKEITNE